jgi:transposase-like protein
MARIKYQEAAGLEVKRGRPLAGPTPSKTDLVKLYVKEAKSVRVVAATLGSSKDAIHRALKKYRIKARTNARRGSALLQYPLSDMKAAVKEKGIRGYARELGISEGTLRHNLKVRKGK